MDYRIQKFIHDSKGEFGVSINEKDNSLTVFPIDNLFFPIGGLYPDGRRVRDYEELLKSLVKLAYDEEVKIDYGCAGARDIWDVYIGEAKVAESYEYLMFTLYITPQCKYHKQLLEDIEEPLYEDMWHYYNYSLVGSFFYRYFDSIYKFATSIFVTDKEYIEELEKKNRELIHKENLFHRAIGENLLDLIRSVKVPDSGNLYPKWSHKYSLDDFLEYQKDYNFMSGQTYEDYLEVYGKVQDLKKEVLERYSYLDEEHVEEYINEFI